MAIRKGLVKVFRVAAQISNKTYRLNEEVTENQFASGVFDDLVKAGKIEITGSVEGVAKYRGGTSQVLDKNTEDEIPETLTPEVTGDKDKDPSLDLDDTTRAQLMADLDYEGIKYSKDATKKELFKLLMEGKK